MLAAKHLLLKANSQPAADQRLGVQLQCCRNVSTRQWRLSSFEVGKCERYSPNAIEPSSRQRTPFQTNSQKFVRAILKWDVCA